MENFGKENISGDMAQHGAQRINILPLSYADLTGTPAMILQILVAIGLGMLIVFLLDKVSNGKN